LQYNLRRDIRVHIIKPITVINNYYHYYSLEEEEEEE